VLVVGIGSDVASGDLAVGAGRIRTELTSELVEDRCRRM
jgi:hypothetical protein